MAIIPRHSYTLLIIPRILFRGPHLLVFLLAWPWTATVAEDWVYTVRERDNLWRISETYLSDIKYVNELQTHNQIADPLNLSPGLRLRIPVAWLKVQPAPVQILAVHGDINIISAEDKAEHKATPKMLLHSGDQIRTGPDANATLEFADGSRLQLFANSELILDTISAYGKTGMTDTRLRLEKGRLENQVAPQSPPAGRFEIWTPAATSAVRGTAYRLAMNPDQATARMEVTGGTVALEAMETTIPVAAGYGTLAHQGEPPATPRPLLAAPDINRFPSHLQQGRIHLEFPPVANATGYRLQIASILPANVTLTDTMLASPRFDTELLAGDYTLRLRAVDADGIEGFEAEHHLTVTTPPVSSTPMWPGILLLIVGAALLL